MARKRTIAILPQEELRRLFYLEQKRSLSRKESLELFKLEELYQKAVEEGNNTGTGDDGGCLEEHEYSKAEGLENRMKEKREGTDKPGRDSIDITHFTEKVSAKIHGLPDQAETYKTLREEFAKSKR